MQLWRAPEPPFCAAAFLGRNAVNGAPNMSICAPVCLVGTAGRFPANPPWHRRWQQWNLYQLGPLTAPDEPRVMGDRRLRPCPSG